MFLSRRGFKDSNCIGGGKGFFQPDFQRPLKTLALDVLDLVTPASLFSASCSGHFNARSARLAGPRGWLVRHLFGGALRESFVVADRRSLPDNNPRKITRRALMPVNVPN
jgi:hypothetical protein